ncbi:Toluene efflux pump membrane transporter TtgH [compost metagenome]
MTSLAFVVGLIPMMYAKGPSAQGNHSISIGAAGGMVSGVILGLLIIPVLFIVFQYLQEKVTGKPVAVIHNHENKNGKLYHNNSGDNHHQPHVHSV